MSNNYVCRLGGGSYGNVFAKNESVAIKKSFRDEEQSFFREIIIMYHLKDKNNIVQICSYNIKELSFEMVRYKKTLLHFYKSNSKITLIEKIPTIFESIINGLCWMHKYNIIHRDIKADNILMDKDDQCYIGDFGISRNCTYEKEPNTYYTCPVYSSHHRPPECNIFLYDGCLYTLKSDIWALGIVFIEYINQEVPQCKNFHDNDGEEYYYYMICKYQKIHYILKKMLNVNYKKRCCVHILKNVKWNNLEETIDDFCDVCESNFANVGGEFSNKKTYFDNNNYIKDILVYIKKAVKIEYTEEIRAFVLGIHIIFKYLWGKINITNIEDIVYSCFIISSHLENYYTLSVNIEKYGDTISNILKETNFDIITNDIDIFVNKIKKIKNKEKRIEAVINLLDKYSEIDIYSNVSSYKIMSEHITVNENGVSYTINI